jgi:hypothetical protein
MTLRPNRGVWSVEDIERLRQHIDRGGSAARATGMFKRTEAAVRAKALELGLKFPSINELRRRARGNPVAAANLNARAAELQAKADADFPREPGPNLSGFERPSPS